MRRPTSLSRLAIPALLLALLAAPTAFAQDSVEDLRSEIEDLKRGQQHMQQQLQEILKLVAARPAAAPARPSGPDVKGKQFDLANNAVQGQLSARLTLVDFTDYQ